MIDTRTPQNRKIEDGSRRENVLFYYTVKQVFFIEAISKYEIIGGDEEQA